MLARAVTENIYEFVLPATTRPDQLVPIAALVREGLRAPALRAAIERGRLKGVRGEDGHYRSTAAWVDEYLAERYRRVAPSRVRTQLDENE